MTGIVLYTDTPAPCPIVVQHPTTFNFYCSRTTLREKFGFGWLFAIICKEYRFGCSMSDGMLYCHIFQKCFVRAL